ncbi:hypothetical protein MTsPCn5_21170 [Croceitalea sp. MTPC5]|nr:hypothetical protein MTsPCn5_21170 [Croceitalea sp. MTPC5]
MGYGAQANNIIKANRALLKKKRTFKEIRHLYVGYAAEKELEFKKLTEFEKKKIKDKIRVQAKRDRLHQFNISLISLFILVLIIFGAYFLLR